MGRTGSAGKTCVTESNGCIALRTPNGSRRSEAWSPNYSPPQVSAATDTAEFRAVHRQGCRHAQTLKQARSNNPKSPVSQAASMPGDFGLLLRACLSVWACLHP